MIELAFGVREKGHSEKVTEHTVFPVASCSKAFTATLIAMLADEGKLKWDDKVREHLDYFRLSDELADQSNVTSRPAPVTLSLSFLSRPEKRGIEPIVSASRCVDFLSCSNRRMC